MLKVGDKVMWRGGFGEYEPEIAVVQSIEVDCVAKQGRVVESVEWNEVTDRSVIVILDSGNWAYGDQISKAK